MARAPVDATTGRKLMRDEVKEYYTRTSYEDDILLPDRVLTMCRDLFNYLLDTGGPEQKTIIFCVRDRHADDVASQMNNLYAAWCAQNGCQRRDPYAFKCTAAAGGSQYLADLRGASRSHFIATTVELLTTGVDVPCVRNIVFFKYVRSPIAFYQMVGRGTRLHPPTNKLMFRVFDYTDATRLFGEAFISEFRAPTAEPGADVEPIDRERLPTIQVEGFDVHVTDAGCFILTDVDGKAMPVTVEEYKQRLAARLVEEAPRLEDFRTRWIDPPGRRELLASLPEAGRSALLVQQLDDMADYDLYDVLGELGYGLNPRTRTDRAQAFTYKHAAWLLSLPVPTRATLEALAAQFAYSGTEGLENPQIFRMPQVVRAGGLPAMQALGRPADVLEETKARLFAA
jgi:type I restriction enzyme R subunit